jgi:hypothetical protein
MSAYLWHNKTLNKLPMKKSILLLILLLNIAKIYAQDIIILKNGDEIKSIVMEVLSDQIKYKKFENQQGPSYGIEKSKIFMIRYANGSKDVFNQVPNSPKTNRPVAKTIYAENRQESKPNYSPAPIRRSSVGNYGGSSVRSMIYGGIALPTGYFSDSQSIGFFLGDETDIPLGVAGLNISLNGTFNYFTGKDSYYYYGTSYITTRVMPGLKFIAPVSESVELYGLGQVGIGIGIGEGTSTQFNYSFGAGATFNQHLDVSFRYNGATSSSDYYYTYAGPNAFSFCFGYKF